jgi:hypothetical protein
MNLFNAMMLAAAFLLDPKEMQELTLWLILRSTTNSSSFVMLRVA